VKIIASALLDVVVGDIVADTGFTIHVLARDQGGSPLAQPGAGRNHLSNVAAVGANNNRPELFPSVGGQTINTHWGTYTVAWTWS
jgi:hypothetical protein